MDNDEIDDLIDMLNSLRVDYYKLYNKDIKVASIRLRKRLEDIVKRCREMKQDALNHRKKITEEKEED